MSNPYPKVRCHPETHAVLVKLAAEHGRPMTDILAAAATIMLRHAKEIPAAIATTAASGQWTGARKRALAIAREALAHPTLSDRDREFATALVAFDGSQKGAATTLKVTKQAVGEWLSKQPSGPAGTFRKKVTATA